ncbi:potassium channel family protein [bacterium]|nr:potassium channel family protein [bacterium]
MDVWGSKFHDHKHLVLLITLLIMCVVQPLAQGMLGGLVLFDILLTLVLLGIFVLFFKRRNERIWALVIAIPGIAAQWASYLIPADSRWLAEVVHHSLILLFLTLAVSIIIRGIFEESAVRHDHILATVCGYIIAGVAFGNAYQIVDLFVPHAFSIKPEILSRMQSEHTRSFLFNYFSLSTLSGTGYGDITPVWPGVASLTWMEAIFGQFYIAIVVAQLIGLKLARLSERSARDRNKDFE